MVTGVITLEDVLEEVIQDEIIDETDTFETNEHSVPVVRRPGRDRPDVSAYLALFEHKLRDQNKLSPSEVQAVSAFLLTAVPEFSVFASVDTVLKVIAHEEGRVLVDCTHYPIDLFFGLICSIADQACIYIC